MKPLLYKQGFINCSGVDSESSSLGLFVCWGTSIEVDPILSFPNYIFYKLTSNGCFYDVVFVYGAPKLEQVEDLGVNKTKLPKQILDYVNREFQSDGVHPTKTGRIIKHSRS